jgi:hypothetical protein
MCFIWMLRMFAMVFKCFHVFFQVFQKHVSSVSSVFRRMLQLLYLDVSKANRVLHLSSPSVASSRCVLLPAQARHPYDATAGSFQMPPPSPLVARAAQAHVECVKRSAARVHPSERPGASTAFFFLPSHTMNMSIVIEWLNSEKRKTSTRLVYLIELHKFRQSLDSEDVFQD